MFGNSVWHFLLTNSRFYLGKEILRLSVMLWAFLSHGNLSLNSEKFKFVDQRKVNPCRCPTGHYREVCLR